MWNRAVVLSLALALPAAGCTPVAVGAVVTGGASIVTGKVLDKDDCDTEGCAYTNVIANLLLIVGLGLTLSGGIYLGVTETR